MQHPKGYWRNWSEGDTFKSIMSAVLNKYSVAPSKSKSQAYKGFVGKNQDYGW
jgi:hypothetical protein